LSILWAFKEKWKSFSQFPFCCFLNFLPLCLPLLGTKKISWFMFGNEQPTPRSAPHGIRLPKTCFYSITWVLLGIWHALAIILIISCCVCLTTRNILLYYIIKQTNMDSWECNSVVSLLPRIPKVLDLSKRKQNKTRQTN
jgi:hypothetical protein